MLQNEEKTCEGHKLPQRGGRLDLEWPMPAPEPAAGAHRSTKTWATAATLVQKTRLTSTASYLYPHWSCIYIVLSQSRLSCNLPDLYRCICFESILYT